MGGVGIGGGPSLVAAGDVRVPYPGRGGRIVAEEGSVRDSAGPNCVGGGVIRSNACCGGEAPGGCLLVCSPVLAAPRVRALVLVKMWPSEYAPLVAHGSPYLPCLAMRVVALSVRPSSWRGTVFDATAVSSRFNPSLSPIWPASLHQRFPPNRVNFHEVTALLVSLTRCCSWRRGSG